jgi:protein-disulfide isomerase
MAKSPRRIKLPSLKIPKLNFSLREFFENSKAYTPVLLVLLLISSFLLGALTTKLASEKGSSAPDQPEIIQGTGDQPKPGEKVDVSAGKLPLLGNKDAKVTLVEFTDFQCPFCKRFTDEALVQIKKDYIDTGKANLAVRHYPITAIHPNAFKASEAAECANEQGKFWEYHDTLFTDQAKWETQSAEDAKSTFVGFAQSLGLDTGSFSSCLDSEKHKANIDQDLADGQKAGVTGTPTIFVNGTAVVGAQPYETFKAEIEKALAG